MEFGSDLVADLFGPLPDPLMDDSLVRSSDHDSSGIAVQRHAPHCARAAVSGGQAGSCSVRARTSLAICPCSRETGPP
eukprot:7333272-Alexandrium_andersonii.AAC.1